MRSRSAPHGFLWEVADHAIDLALSARRPDGPYLAHDSLRNARSIVARRRRRNRLREVDLLAINGSDVSAQVESNPAYARSAPPDPEEEMIWKDALTRLAAVVASLRHGPVVLEDLIEGQKVRSTAAAIGISERHVKSARAKIRSAASDILAP